MSLLTDKSQLQADIESIDSSVLRAAQAANYFAGVVAESNRALWSLPMDRLLAVLNHNVPLTIARFQSNESIAISVNAQLDAFDSSLGFSNRIPVERGNPYVILDMETMQFIDTTPPPEESPIIPE